MDLVYTDFIQCVELLNNHNTRVEAERRLQDIRSGPHALDVTKLALQKSSDQLVLFHALSNFDRAGSVLKLSVEEINSFIELLENFISYTVSVPNYPSFVSRKAHAAVAFLLKICWLDFSKSQRDFALHKRMLEATGTGNLALGLYALSAILHEFATPRDRSQLKPLYYHKECQIQFENEQLLKLLEYHLMVLASGSLKACSVEFSVLVANLEAIFNWDFVENSSGAGSVESGGYPKTWGKLLNSPDTTLILARAVSDLCLLDEHANRAAVLDRVLQCLCCLCSVRQFLLETDHIVGTVARLMQFAFESKDQLHQRESFQRLTLMLGVMANKLLSSLQWSSLLKAGEATQLFLRYSFELCQLCLAQVARTRRVSEVDENWSMEASVEFLSMWATVSLQSLPAEFQSTVKNACFLIYKSYLLARLHFAKLSGTLDDEEFDEDAPKDADQFDEQLQQVALIGRFVISESSSLLLEQFCSHLKALMHVNELNTGAFVGCCESLHWLLLISGHLLGDSPTTGERLLVPDAVAQLQDKELTTCLSLVTGAVNLLQYLAGCPAERSSPLLCESVYWFCARILPPYMYCDPADYVSLSSLISILGDVHELPPNLGPQLSTLLPHFSLDGGGPSVLVVLINSSISLAQLKSSESFVMIELLNCFRQLARVQKISVRLGSQDQLLPFVELFVTHLDRWPVKIHEDIMLTVTCLCTAFADHERREAVLSQVFGAVVGRLIGQGSNQTPDGTLSALDMCIGVSLACSSANALHIWRFQRHAIELILGWPSQGYPEVGLITRFLAASVSKQCFEALGKLDVGRLASYTVAFAKKFCNATSFAVEEGTEITGNLLVTAVRLIENCSDSSLNLIETKDSEGTQVAQSLLGLLEIIASYLKVYGSLENSRSCVKLVRLLFENVTPALAHFSQAEFYVQYLLTYGLTSDDFDTQFEAYDACNKLASAVALDKTLQQNSLAMLERILLEIFGQFIFGKIDNEVSHLACEVVFHFLTFSPQFLNSEAFFSTVLLSKQAMLALELSNVTELLRQGMRLSEASIGSEWKTFIKVWIDCFFKFATRARDVVL